MQLPNNSDSNHKILNITEVPQHKSNLGQGSTFITCFYLCKNPSPYGGFSND